MLILNELISVNLLTISAIFYLICLNANFLVDFNQLRLNYKTPHIAIKETIVKD